MDTMTKAAAMRDYLRQTTGTEGYHRHWTRTLRYTDGVAFMAETLGAHWLIDLIASYQPTPTGPVVKHGGPLVRDEPFQVWYLTAPRAEGKPWVVECRRDTGEPIIVRQEIGYSDFPPELSPWRLWVEDGVLLLPAEH